MKRTYTVPLRRSFVKTEKHQRAKKATSVLRAFLAKHMKTDTVKIGNDLNMHLWSQGIKNPPGKVTVVCEKDDVGVVYADLEGRELQTDLKRKEEAEKAKEEKAAKKVEKKAEKEEKPAEKSATEPEAKKEEKKAPAKKEEKPKAAAKKKPAEKKEATAE